VSIAVGMTVSVQEEVQYIIGFGEFKSIAQFKAINGIHAEDNFQMPNHLFN
jgi:hypothetical protein